VSSDSGGVGEPSLFQAVKVWVVHSPRPRGFLGVQNSCGSVNQATTVVAHRKIIIFRDPRMPRCANQCTFRAAEKVVKRQNLSTE
ncbi:hypothetical protein BaRGS_00028881, partial [Batillaria attramentaria]